MAVVYDVPIVEQKSINASRARGFCVNLHEGIIDIMYEDGNRDADGVFMATGEVKNIHLDNVAFSAIVAANPNVYAAIKQLINDQILVAKNQTGTIV